MPKDFISVLVPNVRNAEGRYNCNNAEGCTNPRSHINNAEGCTNPRLHINNAEGYYIMPRGVIITPGNVTNHPGKKKF